jgi:hypothetical protein
MRLYSRRRASTSVDARIHSTVAAATVMAAVRGWSPLPQYEARRLRSDRAFPT